MNTPYEMIINYLIEFPEEFKIKPIVNGDWIDLRAARDISLNAGDFIFIPLGFSAQLPKGYEAHVAPRSSTFKNFGIIQVNGVGVIDESYCGPNDQWMMPVIAMRDTVINFGDRICQFRLMRKMDYPAIVEQELKNENRGGFGSTGVK